MSKFLIGIVVFVFAWVAYDQVRALREARSARDAAYDRLSVATAAMIESESRSESDAGGAVTPEDADFDAYSAAYAEAHEASRSAEDATFAVIAIVELAILFAIVATAIYFLRKWRTRPSG